MIAILLFLRLLLALAAGLWRLDFDSADEVIWSVLREALK